MVHYENHSFKCFFFLLEKLMNYLIFYLLHYLNHLVSFEYRYTFRTSLTHATYFIPDNAS
jgi:hypothetical protein